MDGMTELETLREFFKAYETLQAIPKGKGRPSLEWSGAKELLDARASAVRSWKVEGAAPAPDASVQAYRALAQQVASIPPKDTRGQKAKTPIG
jgi:hypothetical protein